MEDSIKELREKRIKCNNTKPSDLPEHSRHQPQPPKHRHIKLYIGPINGTV
jgi:hypothetical protein